MPLPDTREVSFGLNYCLQKAIILEAQKYINKEISHAAVKAAWL
jgi:hypothetical protein